MRLLRRPRRFRARGGREERLVEPLDARVHVHVHGRDVRLRVQKTNRHDPSTPVCVFRGVFRIRRRRRRQRVRPGLREKVIRAGGHGADEPAPRAPPNDPPRHRREEESAGGVLTLEVDLRRGHVDDEHDLLLVPLFALARRSGNPARRSVWRPFSTLGDGLGSSRFSTLPPDWDGVGRCVGRPRVRGNRQGRGKLRTRAPVRDGTRRGLGLGGFPSGWGFVVAEPLPGPVG
mmetsp:Transcript_4573/g.17124  ORF Transcript_4573/g.17124 Transcript_4573/m.17124 type:complete len:232 (+) Transcript_4573:563-1258(+)